MTLGRWQAILWLPRIRIDWRGLWRFWRPRWGGWPDYRDWRGLRPAQPVFDWWRWGALEIRRLREKKGG
jgi:hypothetical protein